MSTHCISSWKPHIVPFILFTLLHSAKLSWSKILTEPELSQDVTLNSTVYIKCIVEARESMTVSWLKDEFGIGGSREQMSKFGRSRYDLPNLVHLNGDYTLKIEHVDLSDDAKYKCQLQYNDVAKIFVSQTARLNVLVPSISPQIYKRDKNHLTRVTESDPAVVRNNQPLELECQAKLGKPAAKIFWHIGNRQVVTGSDGRFHHNGLTGTIVNSVESVEQAKLKKLRNSTSVLKIDKVDKTYHNTGVYCRAVCKGYSHTLLPPAHTKFSVNYGPIVTMISNPVSDGYVFHEHSEVKFECNADGRPSNFLWSWSQNGQELSNIKDSWYKVTINRLMHNNVFKCTAMAGLGQGEDSASITVQVLYGPQFKKSFASFHPASVGDTVDMRCEVDSNPHGDISWTKEGSSEVLQRGEEFRRINIKKEDFGTYLCTADVKDFARISKKVYLKERGPPKIQSGPVIYARYGQMAQVHCQIAAVPSPNYKDVEWKKEGVKIVTDGSKDSRIEVNFSKRLGGAVSTVYINGVRKNDFGDYNCSVKNGYGSTTALIKLVPQDQIPIPFIAGASVAIVMTLLVVIVVLCVCRKGFCDKEFQKGHLHSNGLNANGLNSMELDGGCIHPNYYQWSHSSSENPNNFVRFGQDIDGSSARNGSLTRYQGVELASTCSGTDKLMMQIEEEENQPEDSMLSFDSGYSPGPNRITNPITSTGMPPHCAIPTAQFPHINQGLPASAGMPMRTSPLFSLPSQYNPSIYTTNGGPPYLLAANPIGNYPTLTRRSTGLVDPSSNQNAFADSNTSAYLLNSQATNV